MRQFGSGNHIVIICFRIVFYLFSYCELKLVTCVNAEIALVNFTIFVQTMGVTVSEVFKNDFLIVSFSEFRTTVNTFHSLDFANNCFT